MAGLLTVAEQAVVAVEVIGNMDHQVEVVVTVILGAGESVGDGHRRPGQTTQSGAAGFGAIAVEVIVADGINGGVLHQVIVFVAEIGGTSNPIIDLGDIPGDAFARKSIAGLGTVAEEPIVASASAARATAGAVADVVGAARVTIVTSGSSQQILILASTSRGITGLGNAT